MQHKKSEILLGLIAFAALWLPAACGSKSADKSAVEEVEANDSIPAAVKSLVRAVADNDSNSFAKLVSYPLQRPYPLHDIEDEDQMRHYYKQMVDDSLRNMISCSKPAHWSEFGWRGWSLDDGRYVWVDETVYDVPYVSSREKTVMDSLIREEVNSLAPSLREGWRPIMCLRDEQNGNVYRIDEHSEAETSRYRLATYVKGSNLKEMPAKLVEGKMESEGTAGTVLYIFNEPEGAETAIEPDSPDTGFPVLLLPNDSTIVLKRAYWHELINK